MASRPRNAPAPRAKDDTAENAVANASLAQAPRATHSQPGLAPHPLRRRDDVIQLADQLQALASELRVVQSGSRAVPLPDDLDLSEHVRAMPAQAKSPTRLASLPAAAQRERFLAQARAYYEARRRRSAIFKGAELFGEPAWDILLDLYIAFAQDKRVSVSSACIGSASPPTTGLRWLGLLQEAGLIEREHDPRDQRRVLVRLSALGVDRMEAFFLETR